MNSKLVIGIWSKWLIMRHTISLSLLLVVFWLINSGYYDFLLLFLGAVSIVFVIFLSHRMNVVDHESQPLHLTKRIPAYWLWLIKEIVLANLDVTYRIWRGNSTISPRQFVLKVSQRTDMGKAIIANSITLIPGTVSIDVDGDGILVHALTKKAGDELEAGSLDMRVSRLEF